MKTRLGRVGRLPGRIKPRFGRAFHAKEVHPPFGWIEVWSKVPHRQGNFRCPNLLFLIHMDPGFHSAPRISPVAGRLVQIDIQVDPHAVRTNLKFPITVRSRSIRLQKHFRHVPVPELIPPPVRVAVRKSGEVAVAACKPQEERLCCPQQPYFGASLWIGVSALPVSVKSNGLRVFPGARSRKTVLVKRSGERQCDCRASRRRSPVHDGQ